MVHQKLNTELTKLHICTHVAVQHTCSTLVVQRGCEAWFTYKIGFKSSEQGLTWPTSRSMILGAVSLWEKKFNRGGGWRPTLPQGLVPAGTRPVSLGGQAVLLWQSGTACRAARPAQHAEGRLLHRRGTCKPCAQHIARQCQVSTRQVLTSLITHGVDLLRDMLYVVCQHRAE